MLGVLNSLRDSITKFVMCSQPLKTDAGVGSNVLDLRFARKYFVGDQVVIRNGEEGEIHTVVDVLDGTTIVLDGNLVRSWTVAEGAVVEKAFIDQYVKRIYVGDPDVIPDYPAIVITCDSRDEEWWTIDSTIKSWNCTISCLYEDMSLETAYESMLSLTDSVEKSLWANRFPIFGVKAKTNVTSDVSIGDTVVSVASTAGLIPGETGHIEDESFTQIASISRVIDDNRVELVRPAFNDYSSESCVIVIPSRWTMWSYPKSTDYGYIHKGTLLKASQIKWYAQEEVVRLNRHSGPVIL